MAIRPLHSRAARRAAAAFLGTCLATSAIPGQEWSVETLRSESAGFLEPGVMTRLQQIAKLVDALPEARPALVAAIQGDHREYRLKIERYLDQLRDPRWQVREEAERTLIELGGRGLVQIGQRAQQGETLEERIRAKRIEAVIVSRGTTAERNAVKLLQGFCDTAAYVDPDPRLQRALVSATGHTDPIVVENAIHALGVIGDASAVELLVARAGAPPGSGTRRAAIAALGGLDRPEATAAILDLLGRPGALSRDESVALLRDLRRRPAAAAAVAALGEGHPDEVVRAVAALPSVDTGGSVPVVARFVDRDTAKAAFLGVQGGDVLLGDVVAGLEVVRTSFGTCPVLEFGHESIAPQEGVVRVFLKQGTLISGRLTAIDADAVRIESPVFGTVSVTRDRIQGLAVDPDLDRLVGASSRHDRIRTRDGRMLDGQVVGLDETGLRYRPIDTDAPVTLPLAEVAGLMFQRPTEVPIDDSIYVRIDLIGGDKLLAWVGDAAPTGLSVVVPGIGSARVPIGVVRRVEFGVGGGALWGFTLIADYSENRVAEVDDQGREVFTMEDVYGAWDVECLDSGNLLVTEFALNRIVELTREGQEVWSFSQLKNPYDADRLPNGNTLIADTFGERVVEVSPDGQIVWEFQGAKPYDVDRLANGNTLIADGNADRVIEVAPNGEIVWVLEGMQSVHDADRLPNGNTLVTQRMKHRVIEVDPSGTVVFALERLSSPSDADRLPNGNTLVAESGGVREFDRSGNVVWERPVAWAVEVNRY